MQRAASSVLALVLATPLTAQSSKSEPPNNSWADSFGFSGGFRLQTFSGYELAAGVRSPTIAADFPLSISSQLTFNHASVGAALCFKYGNDSKSNYFGYFIRPKYRRVFTNPHIESYLKWRGDSFGVEAGVNAVGHGAISIFTGYVKTNPMREHQVYLGVGVEI